MKTVVLMVVVVLAAAANTNKVAGYKNYTVGDDLGWFDKLEKSTVDYQKWASSKTFSLGDFLIFNTDNNHTVVQTYNSTIYHLCDDSDAVGNDTILYASPDPSASAVHPVSVAVPLTRVGPNYFFSNDYDGEQCENGQRFSINVTQGQGLPPSLRTPTPGAPGPVSQESGDDTVPDTNVPANFDHPKDISDDDDDDDDDNGKKKSNGMITQAWGGFSRILILLGLLYSCW
ncbi:putative Phytocyanin domain, cupredoxin [Helianthus anomalus]